MKKVKTIRGNKIKKGQAVRIVKYGWQSWDLPEDQRGDVYIASDDNYDSADNIYEVVGKARPVKLPGSEYDAFIFKGRLHVGCQNIDALKAFKNLGKALGYKVTE